MGTVAARIPVAGASSLAATDGAVWIAASGQGASTLVRVDPATNQIIDTIDLGTLGTPDSVAIGFGSIWVSSSASGGVLRIDPATGEIVATVSDFVFHGREASLRPHSLTIDERGVWISDNVNKALVLVDPATNKAIASAPVGTVANVVAADGSVWISFYDLGRVVRINPTH